MKQLRNAAILVGLAAYAFFFYVTLLPSLSSPTETWRRGTLVCATALRPEEWLTGNWFGTPPQFSLDDRAVLLLAAGFILAWAAALGWLLLSLFRVTRGLTRLETAVFSMAVGLNLLSTWTLAAGLFGQLGRMRAAGLPALLTFAAAACVWYRRRPRTGMAEGQQPTHRSATSKISSPWQRLNPWRGWQFNCHPNNMLHRHPNSALGPNSALRRRNAAINRGRSSGLSCNAAKCWSPLTAAAPVLSVGTGCGSVCRL